jgi:hypothetical protein
MGKKAKTSNLSHIVDKYIQREAAEEAGDEDDEDEGFVEGKLSQLCVCTLCSCIFR